MKVLKWGNSLAIRLPTSIVEALNLREGDDIEVVIADERAKPVKEKFLERLRKFRQKLPADFKFDREDAEGPPGKEQCT